MSSGVYFYRLQARLKSQGGRLQANPPDGDPEVSANISTTTSLVASKQEGFFVIYEDWRLIGGYLFFAVVY